MNKMTKIIEKYKFLVLVILIVFTIFSPTLVWLAYRLGETYSLFRTAISADAMLTYFVGAISAFAMVFLGFISYWQNLQQRKDNLTAQVRLTKMEDSNFIANFAYLGIVEKIEFNFPNDIIVNFDYHMQQILKMSTVDIDPKNQVYISVRVSLKNIKNLPYLIRIDKFILFPTSVNNVIDTINIRSDYSKVSIGADMSSFMVSLLVDRDTFAVWKTFVIDHKMEISLSANICLISSNYVSTECVFSSRLACQNSIHTRAYYEISEKNSGTVLKGMQRLDKDVVEKQVLNF